SRKLGDRALLDLGGVERLVEVVDADDLVAAREQPLGDVRGDEAGGAGDEDEHQVLMNSRNSRLPAGPSVGDSSVPSTRPPGARANAATCSTAAARWAGSRTTPPLPTSPLPTSNCGFMSATMAPPGATSSARRGSTSTSEMNETSTVASAARSGMASLGRWR